MKNQTKKLNDKYLKTRLESTRQFLRKPFIYWPLLIVCCYSDFLTIFDGFMNTHARVSNTVLLLLAIVSVLLIDAGMPIISSLISKYEKTMGVKILIAVFFLLFTVVLVLTGMVKWSVRYSAAKGVGSATLGVDIVTVISMIQPAITSFFLFAVSYEPDAFASQRKKYDELADEISQTVAVLDPKIVAVQARIDAYEEDKTSINSFYQVKIAEDENTLNSYLHLTSRDLLARHLKDDKALTYCVEENNVLGTLNWESVPTPADCNASTRQYQEERVSGHMRECRGVFGEECGAFTDTGYMLINPQTKTKIFVCEDCYKKFKNHKK